MVADLRKMQENQWVSEIQTDKSELRHIAGMDLQRFQHRNQPFAKINLHGSEDAGNGASARSLRQEECRQEGGKANRVMRRGFVRDVFHPH